MIGIVGGMGPLAGLDVYKKIIEETPATLDQDHSSVLLFSEPSRVPDRTKFLLGEEKINPAIVISEIILKLENAGARVIGIPCNTAHSPRIFNVITAELLARGSKIELLNLIKISTDYLRKHFPGQNIGILSTSGTRKTGIYKEVLENAGLKVIEPELDWQERIHSAVYNSTYGIKAKSYITEKAKSELLEAIIHLKDKGAEVILLGCTEIPLAITEKELEGLSVIDPNRLMARSLLKVLHGDSLKS